MNEFGQTPQYTDWFARLTDKRARARIRSRFAKR